MHEQSITVQGHDGRWYNLNGVTRQRLIPRFPFEAHSYPDLKTADYAARQRSAWIGRLEPEPIDELNSFLATVMERLHKVGKRG